MPESSPKSNSELMQFADLGLRLAVVVAVFTYAGYQLDSWLSTAPWFLIVFCFTGVTAGMMSVVRGVNRWQAAESKKRSERSKPT